MNKRLQDESLKIAKDNLLNKTIVKISRIDESELWDDFTGTLVIHLNDGQRIFASCDEEGNGPGVLFTNKERGMYV